MCCCCLLLIVYVVVLYAQPLCCCCCCTASVLSLPPFLCAKGFGDLLRRQAFHLQHPFCPFSERSAALYTELHEIYFQGLHSQRLKLGQFGGHSVCPMCEVVCRNGCRHRWQCRWFWGSSVSGMCFRARVLFAAAATIPSRPLGSGL